MTIKGLNTRTFCNYRRAALALAIGLTIGAGTVVPASAQNQRQGDSQGQGAGGTAPSGNSGQQGSGNVGSTTGQGSTTQSGTGTGPGGANQQRFGGGTGTDVPTSPPSEEAIRDAIIGNPRGGENAEFAADRCADFARGRMTAEERFEGNNLKRLNAAENFLAPGFDPGQARTGLYLMADYQEELEKRSPDTNVAGIYLALLSTRPVSEQLVVRLNSLLCVSASEAQTREIVESVGRYMEAREG